MPGDTGRDRGKADGGEGGANDSGDDRGRDNDVGYGGMSDADAEAAGDTLAGAADMADALAGWGRQSYGDLNDSPDVADVFGFDRSARGIASGLANLGVSDQDISEALANWGIGYLGRAALLGPYDAVTQGPVTRAISSGLTKATTMASPMAGLLGSLADRVLRGSLTGNYGDLGSALGGIAGSQFGAQIAGDLSQSPVGALAGMMLGGFGGSVLGRGIGSGQASTSNLGDLSAEGNRSTPQGLAMSRAPAMRQPVQVQPGLTAQQAFGMLGMRGFGV